ncbi:MAG: hypothetical protein ABID38_02795 [Candidatus Diapherotrites archaeon]
MESQENKSENKEIGQETMGAAPKSGSMAKKSKTGKKADSGISLYLVVLLVILALFVGFSLNILLAGPASKPIGVECLNLKPLLKTKLIYSDDCLSCADTHTLLLSFGEKDVNYSVERIEASSAEGIKLIGQYQVKNVPVLLIEKKNLKEYWGLEATLAQFYALIGDYYVAYENNWNPQEVVPRMDLIQADGNCNAETPNMLLFDDPYDFISIIHDSEIKAFNEKFGDEIEIEFNFFPKKTMELRTKYGKDAELAVDNLICAQEQGKYFEFKEAVMSVFCDENNDGELTNEEIAVCGNPAMFFYPNYDEPLHQSDIDKVAGMVDGLDLNAMANCLQTVDDIKSGMLEKAELYKISSVPAVIYNCQYRLYAKRDTAEHASLSRLDSAVCGINPSLSAC